jgi:hypothetical protein
MDTPAPSTRVLDSAAYVGRIRDTVEACLTSPLREGIAQQAMPAMQDTYTGLISESLPSPSNPRGNGRVLLTAPRPHPGRAGRHGRRPGSRRPSPLARVCPLRREPGLLQPLDGALRAVPHRRRRPLRPGQAVDPAHRRGLHRPPHGRAAAAGARALAPRGGPPRPGHALSMGRGG